MNLSLTEMNTDHLPVSRVADDIYCLRQPMVNCYFIGQRGGGDRPWLLVDCGMPWSKRAIQVAAANLFGRRSRPTAIVLTHGHFDHVGSAAELAEEWDVPVLVHELELPYVTGRSSYPPPDPSVGGGVVAMMSRFFPKGPIDLGNRVTSLPANGIIADFDDWRSIFTPGHAPGHISLFRERDRALIVGDAFVTQRQESLLGVLSGGGEVWRPPAYFTPDWEAARASVELLAALEPTIAATGHGAPVHGERLRAGLAALLEQWEYKIPRYGRYVNRPAVTDAGGVVATPPPVFDRQLAALGGLAAAVAITILALQVKNRRSPTNVDVALA
jgi:glyoxylase-like metal-dependent hydrolase (beta-lactamase superfamily II)